MYFLLLQSYSHENLLHETDSQSKTGNKNGSRVRFSPYNGKSNPA